MLWGDHVFRIRKIKELLHGIISYIRSHLWVSIMGSLMLLFLLVVLIFQEYLKNEYYDYLLDETWKTESAVLSVASNSLNSMLEESLYACGEMATDKDLYNYVNRLTEADKTTYNLQKKKNLREEYPNAHPLILRALMMIQEASLHLHHPAADEEFHSGNIDAWLHLYLPGL